MKLCGLFGMQSIRINDKPCPFQSHLHFFSFQRLKNPEQHYYNKVSPEPLKTPNMDPLNPTTNIDRLKNIGHLKQALAQSYQTVPGYLSVEDIRYGLLNINCPCIILPQCVKKKRKFNLTTQLIQPIQPGVMYFPGVKRMQKVHANF